MGVYRKMLVAFWTKHTILYKAGVSGYSTKLWDLGVARLFLHHVSLRTGQCFKCQRVAASSMQFEALVEWGQCQMAGSGNCQIDDSEVGWLLSEPSITPVCHKQVTVTACGLLPPKQAGRLHKQHAV
eukprot:3335917-Amphidinium_carterae.1